MFNLYSFDALRATRTQAPVLQLTDCDFKYFASGHDSLIQVETNNLSLMGMQNDPLLT